MVYYECGLPLILLNQNLVLETHANNADPVKTPQNAPSDQDLHYLHIGISVQSIIKLNIFEKPLKG